VGRYDPLFSGLWVLADEPESVLLEAGLGIPEERVRRTRAIGL